MVLPVDVWVQMRCQRALVEEAAFLLGLLRVAVRMCRLLPLFARLVQFAANNVVELRLFEASGVAADGAAALLCGEDPRLFRGGAEAAPGL